MGDEKGDAQSDEHEAAQVFLDETVALIDPIIAALSDAGLQPSVALALAMQILSAQLLLSVDSDITEEQFVTMAVGALRAAQLRHDPTEWLPKTNAEGGEA